MKEEIAFKCCKCKTVNKKGYVVEHMMDGFILNGSSRCSFCGHINDVDCPVARHIYKVNDIGIFNICDRGE